MTHEPFPTTRHEHSLPLEAIDIHKIAHGVFAAHGVRGVRLTIADGGTYCQSEERGGITINIDPSEIAGGHELAPDLVLAAAVHEIGHAIDVIEEGSARRSRTDHFFWNLVDDIVIDTNARRIAAVDQPMEKLYRTVIANKIANQTTDPLASQLMYGMRIGQVLGEQPLLDERVQVMVDGLRSHTAGDGTVFDIIAVLADASTTLRDRRAIAKRYIKPLYDELLETDRSEGRSEQLEQSMAEYEQTHAHHDNNTDGQPGENQPAPSLPEQISQAIEDAAKSKPDNSAEQSGDMHSEPTDDSEGENEPSTEAKSKAAGRIAAEMNLSPADAAGYLDLALTHQATIRGVADVFKQLARPTAATQRMTYQRRRTSDGPIIHTAALGDIVLGQQLGVRSTHIWRDVRRSAERQTRAFGGLDIHLLVDVSSSMQSVAPEATAMAISLLEGLGLARTQVAKDNQLKQPDVRTHVVAFGSSTEEVAPLSHHTTLQQKGIAYSNLMRPNARSTLINDALLNCRPTPDQSERDHIILIVSDGAFGDHADAVKTVETLPKNAYVGQLIIGTYDAITPNSQTITNTIELPAHLLRVLQQYVQKYQ